MSMKDGRVYIDGKQLYSFYATVKRAGLGKDAYMEQMDLSANNKEDAVDFFEMMMDEIVVGAEEYFMIDDDWLRGRMNLLERNDLLGKVIGYHE